jgi:hypothetical protein
VTRLPTKVYEKLQFSNALVIIISTGVEFLYVTYTVFVIVDMQRHNLYVVYRYVYYLVIYLHSMLHMPGLSGYHQRESKIYI